MAGMTRREDGDATRREASGVSGVTRRESSEGRHSTASLMRLPSALADRYTVVEEIASRGAEADLLLVEDGSGDRWVAKIFRTGIEPKMEVFERVAGAAAEHVIRLHEHGRSDGRVWVLLEYAPLGSLTDLFRREGPRLDERIVDEVLRELSSAIAHLHSLGIEHRDLKPDNVLVRTRNPLDLVLIDFGIASLVDASVHFTSAHRTIRYAPPEAQSGTLHKSRWDYWSLGMILVDALAGRHPFDGLSDQIVMSQLATRPVDDLVIGVADARWRALCRGLLRRDPKNRWGKAEIDRWLRGDTSLTVVEEGAPAAHQATGHKPYSFAGNSYATPAALAAGLAVNWPEAVKHLEHRQIKNWLASQVGDQDLVVNLQDLDEQEDLDPDTRLFRVLLLMDPKLPPSFMGTILNQDALRNWALGTLEGVDSTKFVLRKLRTGRVLSSASDVTGDPQLATIEREWFNSIEEYERLGQQVRNSSSGISVAQADDTVLANLLLASLPGSSDAAAHLRQRASQLVSADARECDWFRNLGDPDRAGPSALLLMSALAHQAEEQTQNRREAEQRAAAERRATEERAAAARRYEIYQHNVRVYGNLAGTSVGLLWGVAYGVVTGIIPGGIFIGPISWFSEKAAVIIYIIWIILSAIFHTITFEKAMVREWISNKENDADAAKSKALLIFAIPLIVIVAAVAGLAVFNASDYDSEAARINTMITRAVTAEKMQNGRPVNEKTNFRGASSPVAFFMEYEGARANLDFVTLVLFKNNTQTSTCAKFFLKRDAGWYQCTWDILYIGQYQIRVFINDQFVHSRNFSIQP